ncbi:MAG: hypothetical protein IJ538_03085 [Clostridia bacterium]|nr:hypothetical protein [Clostridia bacterium]
MGEQQTKNDFEIAINNKCFNESYAKYLMEEYSPEFKFAVVRDKPDIQLESRHEVGSNPTPSIGIEVTTLMDTYRNALARFRRFASSSKMSIEGLASHVPTILKGIIGVNKHGNLIVLGSRGERTIKKGLSGIARTLEIKYKKLQEYEQFDENDLFIFAINLSAGCDTTTIGNLIRNFDKRKYEKRYNYIYIFTYETLQIYEAETGKSVEVDITNETREICNARALKDKLLADERNAPNKPKAENFNSAIKENL